MTILIKHGHVVDPHTKRDGCFDVLVENEKIKEVAEHIEKPADTVIDERAVM